MKILLFILFLQTSVSLASSQEMEYVTICNEKKECRKFSRLVMGTDHLIQGNWVKEGQPENTQEEAYAVLDEAVKNGINFFDTSPIYVGGVEHSLGQWRASREKSAQADQFYYSPQLNPDRKLYVLSKGGFPFDLYWAKSLEAGVHSPELIDTLKKKGILAPGAELSLTQSTPLKNVPTGTYASRLFGDYEQIRKRTGVELGHTLNNLNGDITVYLMHRDDGDAVDFQEVPRPKMDINIILKAIGSHKAEGKFWMHGWSNWKTDRINKSLQLVQKNKKLPKPIINSPYFSLFEMSPRTIHALAVQVTHKEMMNPNFEKGIKIMPYSPLGGFSILDKPEPKWENAKAAAKKKLDSGDAYWKNVFDAIFTKDNEARWNRVVEFTKVFNLKHETQYTVDQMMNAYVLAHPRTDLLAIGAITKEQVKRTVKSLELAKRLTPNFLDYLYAGVKDSEVEKLLSLSNKK
ncbi:MAG: hypothetical protein COW00_14525 [Bdellovibrio sp. CG12_big_fil_rev_8_21_14_0_65_39_13]|nr:MAG: hypothetical protein COW78_07735 [Bdellovibrio sp. CG22_combo_CG10-13_8_21_14_all_39_27]PIQ58827.1 MAG: hypothetical protein COW00_14525 [Bdellovibrio sp. CG12_big_fil_rev_8_21_14_0_65_39_13]PIR35495.1 MAG: hypothetical protein COV37_08425 [Bdellovibrio sp. CG11_big_fil_rev_8_21_14_0_20_39_38]